MMGHCLDVGFPHSCQDQGAIQPIRRIFYGFGVDFSDVAGNDCIPFKANHSSQHIEIRFWTQPMSQLMRHGHVSARQHVFLNPLPVRQALEKFQGYHLLTADVPHLLRRFQDLTSHGPGKLYLASVKHAKHAAFWHCSTPTSCFDCPLKVLPTKHLREPRQTAMEQRPQTDSLRGAETLHCVEVVTIHQVDRLQKPIRFKEGHLHFST
mmetsp:Transcript_39161/g.64634  ORF Transcript_39161/g.64634 Transcript_39161/m.64634 type:complete len:208 (-) Transcript_39161:422-1045(-)